MTISRFDNPVINFPKGMSAMARNVLGIPIVVAMIAGPGPAAAQRNHSASLPLRVGSYVDRSVACANASMATEAQFDGRTIFTGGSSIDNLRPSRQRGTYSGRITWVRGERVNIPIRVVILNRSEFIISNDVGSPQRMRFCSAARR